MKSPRPWKRGTKPNFPELSPAIFRTIKYLSKHPDSSNLEIRDNLGEVNVNERSFRTLFGRLRECGILKMRRNGKRFLYSVTAPYSDGLVLGLKIKWLIEGLFEGRTTLLVQLLIRKGHLNGAQFKKLKEILGKRLGIDDADY